MILRADWSLAVALPGDMYVVLVDGGALRVRWFVDTWDTLVAPHLVSACLYRVAAMILLNVIEWFYVCLTKQGLKCAI